MERKLCPAAAALAGGTGVTAEEGALDRAPRPSITCSELCRRSRSRERLRGSCRSASGAGTAASRRQLPVLLLSGSAGTGAERVGVTDTRGLPRACAGAGIRWGIPGSSALFGKRGWFCESPTLHVTASPSGSTADGAGSRSQRGSLGWGSLQVAPWGWREGCRAGTTPEQSQISLRWGLGAQAPL